MTYKNFLYVRHSTQMRPQANRRAQRELDSMRRQEALRRASVADPLKESRIRLPPEHPYLHDGPEVLAAVVTGNVTLILEMCSGTTKSAQHRQVERNPSFADVNYIPSGGDASAALHTAVSRGDLKVVQVLLGPECNADADLVDPANGYSALHIAITAGYPMVRYISTVWFGVAIDMNYVADCGRVNTSMLIIVYTKVLLPDSICIWQAQANVNLRSHDGMSALYMAVTRASKEPTSLAGENDRYITCAISLLKAAADINLEDYKKLCAILPIAFTKRLQSMPICSDSCMCYRYTFACCCGFWQPASSAFATQLWCAVHSISNAHVAPESHTLSCRGQDRQRGREWPDPITNW